MSAVERGIALDSTPLPPRGQAKELYEALRCPKDYVLFTAEEGAASHCEGGAQVHFHSKVFDWLDKTLMEASPRAAVT